MTENDFLHLLQSFLPPGPAWSRSPEANLTKVLRGIASIFYMVYLRALKIVKEANPATTEEMLADWEETCGLPGIGSYEERIFELIAFLTEQNSQSIQSYRKAAEKLGIDIDILIHQPFRIGYSQCGGEAECGGENIVFFWEIIIKNAPSDQAVENMKRIFERKNQAHLVLTFIDKRSENEIH